METNRLSWLSLRVLQKGTFIKRPGKTPLLFSIPKKVVPLAVKRNRLKRLIREAVRQEAFFKGSEDRVYWFRVFKAPQVLDLNGVKQTIKGLLEGPVG
ncbi:MAG: ribonuclease P protein component [Candidatus Omnitrophica bacterium]|nr:ribonuclease P protein component [Candidatus Omnitrophota bacterium]